MALRLPASGRNLGLTFGALVLAAAAVCAGFLLWPAAAVAAPSSEVGQQLDTALPADIADLPLVDQNGHATSLAAYRGKILMISDTMTLCQETCPLDTADLVQTARQLDAAGDGANVEFLTITIDPTRDTPAQLAAYRALFQPVPANWATLTGDPAVIAKLWKFFGVWIQKVAEGTPATLNWRTGQPLTYNLNHSDEIFFIDGSGTERFLIEGMGHVAPGTPLPSAMKKFMDAEGLQNMADPASMSWTVPQGLQTLGWLLQKNVPGAAAF